MSNTSKNIWKTRDGRNLPMEEMGVNHIQRAFLCVNLREYDLFLQMNELHRKLNKLNMLKSKLKQVAEKRKIDLVYPDQKDPGPRWGIYFEAERKTNAMIPEKAVLAPNER